MPKPVKSIAVILKTIINHFVHRVKWEGRVDEHFCSLGIQEFSMDKFVDYLNDHGLKGKVVVKTNSSYLDRHDDEYSPREMVFLVMDSELAIKIAGLGFIPETKEND